MDIELFNNKLKVFECGKVLVKRCNRDEYYEKFITKTKTSNSIRLTFECKSKNFKIHRIIGFAYLGLNIHNTKQVIDHIDRNPRNNQLTNLRIVSLQQNQFNRNAKGFYKVGNKYQAQIRLNGKQYHLGMYPTRELAHNAYLEGKKILHIIPNHP